VTVSSSGEQVSDWREWVTDVPDYPQPGIVFRDLTPLWADGAAWKLAADCLARNASAQLGAEPEYLLAVEARGFLVAQALADRWGSGILLARKPGKLPRSVHRQDYELEYGSAGLEVHDQPLPDGARVLIVDDVLATGGTAQAAMYLAGQLGGPVVGFSFLIELAALGGRERLGALPITSLITYREDNQSEILS
jgi:adenine phosphoribosyltransferase